jgi:hypothetical protein
MEVLNTINLIIVIAIGIIAIHNFTHLKQFRSEKCKLRNDLPILYPLVKPDFVYKPIARQTVENNHEIHELNKKIEVLESNYKVIKYELDEIIERVKNG